MDKCGENVSLCFTDTDSLLYQIKTNNVFKDIMENHNLFDLSNYVDNHEIFYGKTKEEIKFLKNENKKVIGKFKDEVGGIILEEFIGLRPKCYSILYGWLQKQIAKGVKETVKKVHLRHDNYVEVRENLSVLYMSQNTINSKKHQLHSIHQMRMALTAFDTKRWICNNNIDTYAYGHYRTRDGEDINWDENIDVFDIQQNVYQESSIGYDVDWEMSVDFI